jgi:hypothetical protein
MGNAASVAPDRLPVLLERRVRQARRVLPAHTETWIERMVTEEHWSRAAAMKAAWRSVYGHTDEVDERLHRRLPNGRGGITRSEVALMAAREEPALGLKLRQARRSRKH